MNKHNSPSILNILFLIAIALSSGCGAVTLVPSPTLTPTPSQTPTDTATPSPTNTPEPIHPKGTIFYSDADTLYSVDLQSHETKIVFSTDVPLQYYLIRNGFIYTRLNTNINSQGKDEWEVFKIKLDGSEPEQLTTGGVIEEFNIDPNEKYLTYNTYDRVLKLLNIANKTSEVIAKPNKNSEWIWAYSWSPDGKKLIYSRIINPGLDDICSLFIYDIATKKSVALSPMDIGCPANWSPDGKSILFTTHKDQQLQMGILNLESGEINYVPVGIYSYHSGSWSQDGKQLIIAVIDKQKQTYLYFFNWQDGSVNLISKIGYLQWPTYYSWSPDGNMVLYEQGEPSLSYKHYLYFLDIKNNKITNLYTLPGLNERFDYWWKYFPTWSPDGKYFAYFTMSSSETDYEQNFILNIKSIETEGNIQIQVPRKGFSIRMVWINNKTKIEN